MKNVVDSNGNVFDTSQLKNAFKIKKYEARIEELKTNPKQTIAFDE